MNRRTFIKVATALPVIGTTACEKQLAVVAKCGVGQTAFANHIDLAPYLIRAVFSSDDVRLEPFVMFPSKAFPRLLWLQKSATPGGKSWWECLFRDPHQTLSRYLMLPNLEKPVYIKGVPHHFKMANAERYPNGVIASTPTDDGEHIWTIVPRWIL